MLELMLLLLLWLKSPVVYPLDVDVEVALLCGPKGAEGTRVGLLSRVLAEMLLQPRLSVCGVATVWEETPPHTVRAPGVQIQPGVGGGDRGGRRGGSRR